MAYVVGQAYSINSSQGVSRVWPGTVLSEADQIEQAKAVGASLIRDDVPGILEAAASARKLRARGAGEDEAAALIASARLNWSADAILDRPSSGTATTRIAAATLSGHRFVREVGGGCVDVCDPAVAGQASAFLGMTRGAAIVGDEAAIAVAGEELSEPSWSWVTGAPIRVGAGGIPTQAYDPSLAWALVAGFATSPTSIRIAPREPIAL